MVKTMTVTKALSELKLLDKRINKGIYDTDFVGLVEGNSGKVKHVDIESFKKEAKSKLSSIIDLIEYRNQIKSAIVASNATTFVTIGGKTYTVASAIERKSSIEYETELLSILKSQYTRVTKNIDLTNKQVENRLDNALSEMFSSDGKKDNAFIDQFTKNFNDKYQAKLVDPIDIKKVIDTLEEDIDEFLSEVDHELSTSNALTTINIETEVDYR